MGLRRGFFSIRLVRRGLRCCILILVLVSSPFFFWNYAIGCLVNMHYTAVLVEQLLVMLGRYVLILSLLCEQEA